MIHHQNQTAIKLTRRCETLNAMTLRELMKPSFCESVSSVDSCLGETALVDAFCPSPTLLPSSTMGKREGRRKGLWTLGHR